MIELNVYKNTDTTSAQYGKAYARVDYKEQFDVNKLAQATGEYSAAELNKDAVLGWTKKAKDAIDADVAKRNFRHTVVTL